MKTLYLIRHAKSSWDDSTHSDFERTLNEQGKKDAPKMGKLLKEKNIIPDFLISSPAIRAISTAKIFASQIDYTIENILTDERIYDASMKDLAEIITEMDDKYNSVFLFGHNPGLSNFANQLGDKSIHEMPTCSVVGFQLNISSWKKIERHCGKIELYEYPKKYNWK